MREEAPQEEFPPELSWLGQGLGPDTAEVQKVGD